MMYKKDAGEVNRLRLCLGTGSINRVDEQRHKCRPQPSSLTLPSYVFQKVHFGRKYSDVLSSPHWMHYVSVHREPYGKLPTLVGSICACILLDTCT